MGHSAFSWYTVAAWKKPVWYTLTYSTTFDEVIANLEKKNISFCIWTTGIWKLGIWEHGLFDEVIQNLEK